MPNHMENLTIWNFYATNAQTDQDIDTGGKFTWWDGNGFWWKFMPPIIVGRSEERRVGKECRSRWSPYH